MDKENIPTTIASKVNKSMRKNRVPTLNQWGRWTFAALEEVMDTMERGQTSFRKAKKFRHIPLTFLLDHSNGKTKSKNHYIKM